MDEQRLATIEAWAETVLLSTDAKELLAEVRKVRALLRWPVAKLERYQRGQALDDIDREAHMMIGWSEWAKQARVALGEEG